MSRITQISALTLIAATLVAVGCSSSNDPATSTPTGSAGSGNSSNGTAGSGTTPQGGSGGTASNGTAGTASNTAGTNGNPSGGTGNTGTAGAGNGTAGSGTAGTGNGTAGNTGAAGSTGNGQFTPLCAGLTTAAAGNPAPKKGGACTATDPQLCYGTCGPQSVGFKSETCTGTSYAEGDCAFPDDLDATCYRLSPDNTPLDPAACPAGTPQAGQVCDVAACTVCNDGTYYKDSSGAQKAGYCVCPDAAAGATRKWSCASTTAWPCPAGNGCTAP